MNWPDDYLIPKKGVVSYFDGAMEVLMEDQPKYEPIIIKIKNGGYYLELPQEPFLGDIQEVIALLEDFLYLLERKQGRLLGLEKTKKGGAN